MRKKICCLFLIVLLFFIYILLCASTYVTTVSTDISNSVFRLHIIANSNSDNDQQLKYIVRDNILNYMKTIISEDNSIDKYHVITLVSENLDNFKTIAQKTIYDNGYDYPVEIGIGNFSFPTKKYGDISLPSGYYDALQIKIGNAEGKNWWCVLYPNLCFTDVTTSVLPEDSMEILKNTLTDEEYNVIIDNSENIKIKFKFIEIFQSVKEKLSK